MMRFGYGWGGFGGGPFSRFRGFERGDIKYLILDMINEKPRHGYEIIKELETRFYGFYSPSPGSVYPTLQLLEELGWVQCREENGKKTYQITEEGKAELKTQKEKVGSIWDRADSWGSCHMGDLNDLFEDLADLKKFVRARMHAHGLTDEKLKRIRQIITHAKEEILQVLKT